MTNNEYRTPAPEVQALVDAGEISADYAQTHTDLAVLLVDFIVTITDRPEVRELFAMNDHEHFIEGLQSAPWFRTAFAAHLAGLAA